MKQTKSPDSINKTIRIKTTFIDPQVLDNQQQLKSQYMKIIKNIQLKHLRNQVLAYYRKNSTIVSNSLTKMVEQWCSKQDQRNEQDDQIFIPTSTFDTFLYLFSMIFYTATICLTHVDYFFRQKQDQNIPGLYYLFPLLFTAIDLVCTINNLSNMDFSIQYILQKFHPYLAILTFQIFKIAEIGGQGLFWGLFQTIALYFIFCRARQFYKSFRYMSLLHRYQYHFKAFDLIFNLIMVAHAIAIILYQISTVNTKNWFNRLELTRQNQFVNYIYSFYFGTTTILTVGYGDIVPTNSTEITLVILVQIFGIASFAYLINQIGYNLSNLRKDKQIIQKDITVLEKIKNFYRIDEELVSKARTYLVKNQSQTNRLKPQQQNHLISKLNQGLRNQITASSSMAVLKSSIFFLCRWSKNFQNMILGVLTNILLSPGQYLFQPQGKQRIYIIRQGKVDIYARIKKSRKDLKNVVKTIEVNCQKQVSDNCYGYTAFLTPKPIQIFAVSKDFTSAYFIQRQKFMKCVHDKICDIQYFQQMKERINQQQIPQSIQVPSLKSSHFHFNPTKYSLIKKAQIRMKKFKDSRFFFQRNRNRVSNFILQGNALSQLEQTQKQEKSMSMIQDVRYNQNSCIVEYKNIFSQHEQIHMDVIQQYENYFPKHNYNKVIKKYELSYLGKQKQQLKEESFRFVSHRSCKRL